QSAGRGVARRLASGSSVCTSRRRSPSAVMVTLPIGGTNMPAVISLFNAFIGVAVGLEGLVLQGPAITIAGVVLGSAGTLLTLRMARTMSVTDVIVPKQPRHARGPALLRQPRRGQPV